MALHLRHHRGHDLAHVSLRRRPGLRDRVLDDAAQLVVAHLLRQILVDDLCLTLLGAGQVLAARVAVGLGRLEPALALALQHRDLVDLLLARLLGGLLQLAREHAQRAGPLTVTGFERSAGVALDLLEDCHAHLV